MDVESYRDEMPALRDQVYLNFAAVAPPSRRVVAASRAWLEDVLAHGVGGETAWETRTEEARACAARLLGASAGEIAFVRSTGHGLGLIAEGLSWREGDEVAVASSIEFPSNVYPWMHLRDRGVVLRKIEPTRGGVTPEGVAAAMGPRTRLVALSSVQYASGHRADLPAIGALCARHGAKLCIDGIQSVGVQALDVKQCGVHFLAADSHKWMLGLNGVGVLYVDAAVLPELRPVLVGWKSTTDAWNFNLTHFELRSDAAKLEEGSPAYAMIHGLGAALALLEEVSIPAIEARVAVLLAGLERDLRALRCDVAPRAEERAGILTFVPPRGDPASLFAALDQQRFRLSLRRGRLRVAPHFVTTERELEALVAGVRRWQAGA